MNCILATNGSPNGQFSTIIRLKKSPGRGASNGDGPGAQFLEIWGQIWGRSFDLFYQKINLRGSIAFSQSVDVDVAMTAGPGRAQIGDEQKTCFELVRES